MSYDVSDGRRSNVDISAACGSLYAPPLPVPTTCWTVPTIQTVNSIL
jgi:hypothetical protein